MACAVFESSAHDPTMPGVARVVPPPAAISVDLANDACADPREPFVDARADFISSANRSKTSDNLANRAVC